MTTSAEIIQRFDAFLDAVDDLLASSSLDAIADLVTELGGGAAIHEAASTVSGLLRELEGHVDRLIAAIAEPLQFSQIFAGLIGLLQPLMGGLERLVRVSAQELADAGLDSAIQISAPVADAVGFGRKALTVGERLLTLLPPPEALSEIRADIRRLITTVDSYAEATQ